MKYKLIFLDTETTGNTERDRLMQVAYKYWQQPECQVELFTPPLPISVESMAVTHITNRMVEGMPPFAGSSMQSDLQALFSDENNIMVAHNAPFDVDMLKKDNVHVDQTIDTLRVARHLDSEGKIPRHNLQYLRYLLDLDADITEPIQAHDAKGDVIVLEKLFERLFSKVQKQFELDEEAVVEKMMELTHKPVAIKTFTFGKYKGEKIADVAAKDLGYLQWLYKQKKESEQDEADWLFTLEQFVK